VLFNPTTGEEMWVMIGEDPIVVDLMGGLKGLNTLVVARVMKRR
jgi:hypothetical protein